MASPRPRETAIAPPTSRASSALLPPTASRPSAQGNKGDSHRFRRRRGHPPNALVRIPVPRTPRDTLKGIGSPDGDDQHDGPVVRRLDRDALPPDSRQRGPGGPPPHGPGPTRQRPQNGRGNP